MYYAHASSVAHSNAVASGSADAHRPQVIHRVSKNVLHLACYNFDAREWILIIFGRKVTHKVRNQKTLYYVTSNNLCFCTTWQNAETGKSHISLNWIVLHTMHLCAVLLKEKNVICDVFDSI